MWLPDKTDMLGDGVLRVDGQHVPLACPVPAMPLAKAELLVDWSGCSPNILVQSALPTAELDAIGGHLALLPAPAVHLLPILAELVPPPGDTGGVPPFRA